MRIVFMGTPDFSVPVLDAILAAGHDVVAVYSQPPRPAGRGMAETKSPVHRLAEARGIPVSTPVNFKADADRAAFAALKADAAVVVAYGLLLPEAVLAAPQARMLQCARVKAAALARRGADPTRDHGGRHGNRRHDHAHGKGAGYGSCLSGEEQLQSALR